MKRIGNQLFALFLSIAIIFSVFSLQTTANAATVEPQEQQIMELHVANQEVTPQSDGFLVTADLIQETRERILVRVGIAKFNITINSNNRGGKCSWDITLENGDLIKGVYGKFVVKQDLFGPFNPVMATMYVNSKFSTGTLFNVAHGAQYFTFGDYETLDEDENIIFQWRDFSVTGVKGTYIIANDEMQGDIKDFR